MATTYPDKRVLRGSVPDVITELELQWFSTNGWSVCLPASLSISGPVNESTNLSTLEPTIVRCAAYDIPVWLLIDDDMSYPTGFPREPGRDRDVAGTAYAENMALNLEAVEADSRISGYVFEYGYLNGLEYLHGKVDKTICNAYSAGFVNSPTEFSPSYFASGESIDDRLQYIDELIWEWYAININTYPNLDASTSVFQYLMDEFPAIKIGVMDLTDANTYMNVWCNQWADVWIHPFLTYTERKTLAKYYLQKLRDDTKLFDILFPAVFYQWTPVIEQCQFHESLGLFTGATVGARETCGAGISPYYDGASVCTHDTPKIDRFENTGDELLLLKNVDYDDGACRVHSITVTSTDTLTTDERTIALSPTSGKFIGPYPLETYGALPTITYDNTNIYVSILKVTPYADQT